MSNGLLETEVKVGIEMKTAIMIIDLFNRKRRI